MYLCVSIHLSLPPHLSLSLCVCLLCLLVNAWVHMYVYPCILVYRVALHTQASGNAGFLNHRPTNEATRVWTTADMNMNMKALLCWTRALIMQKMLVANGGE